MRFSNASRVISESRCSLPPCGIHLSVPRPYFFAAAEINKAKPSPEKHGQGICRPLIFIHPHSASSIYATLCIYLGIFFPTFFFFLILLIQFNFDSALNHSLWQTVSFHTTVQSCRYQLLFHPIGHASIYYKCTVPSWFTINSRNFRSLFFSLTLWITSFFRLSS